MEADLLFPTFLSHQRSFRSGYAKESRRDGQQDSDHHTNPVPGHWPAFGFPQSQQSLPPPASLPTPSAPALSTATRRFQIIVQDRLESKLATALSAADLLDLFLIRWAWGQAAAAGAQPRSSACTRVGVHLGEESGKTACTPPAPPKSALSHPPHPNRWGIQPDKVFPCSGEMLAGRTEG